MELLLTKLRYAAASPDPEAKPDAAHEGLQIIGMSATMPNVSAVAKWLGAQLYQTDFRCPVVHKSVIVLMCIPSSSFAAPRTATLASLGRQQSDSRHCKCCIFLVVLMDLYPLCVE